MPEAVVNQPVAGSETGNTGDQQVQSPGWLAGLPAELRDNEAFKPYRTVGDFAKAHLETATKAKEYEAKLTNSIPKLGENATQEEREHYLTSLGRPDKPDGYELDKEDNFTPEGKESWKKEFFELGLPKATARELSARINRRLDALVDKFKADNERQIQEASSKLKAEWGDKYDANTELVSRLWKKETDVDFDKAFAGETSANRFTMMRFLYKMAAKTGEDMSSRGSDQRSATPKSGYDLSKFNLPPART
jgi:hypothetical protein